MNISKDAKKATDYVDTVKEVLAKGIGIADAYELYVSLKKYYNPGLFLTVVTPAWKLVAFQKAFLLLKRALNSFKFVINSEEQ